MAHAHTTDAEQPVRDGLDFLRAGPGEIFNTRQLKALEAYRPPETDPEAPPAPATLFLILKATRLCNLRCVYCHAWREGPNQVLPFERLMDVIAQAMRLPGVRWLHIVWHGGETTLLSRAYFQRAIWLQEHFRIDDRRVGHAIQTNATRVDEDWADFFKAADFSVGVSLDLDTESHDRARPFREGGGSRAATRRGMDALTAKGVRHGVLAVVDEAAIRIGAAEVLAGLRQEGIRNAGLLNALPANDGGGDQPYLQWERYTGFLAEVFREWNEGFRDDVVIREIDSLFRIVQGSGSRLCIYQGGCMGQYLTIEPDGRVSACDKYVGDETHEFGSLAETSLQEILTRSAALDRARAEADALLDRFRACPNHRYCRGGCPHDARLNQRHGRDEDCCGLNALIEDMKSVLTRERDHGRSHA